jgi:hypothetical protein
VEKEITMSHYRRFRWWIGILGVLVGMTSCAYETAVRRLSTAEQAQFATYKKVMTSAQVRTYLQKATAVERTAYLAEIGLAQRFEALEALDREAVLSGRPLSGMRADALRFLWGEPYSTNGRTNHYRRSTPHAHQLDWFHLTMQLTVLDQYAKGLVHCDQTLGEVIRQQIERLKWSLWHGNLYKALYKEVKALAEAA